MADRRTDGQPPFDASTPSTPGPSRLRQSMTLHSIPEIDTSVPQASTSTAPLTLTPAPVSLARDTNAPHTISLKGRQVPVFLRGRSSELIHPSFPPESIRGNLNRPRKDIRGTGGHSLTEDVLRENDLRKEDLARISDADVAQAIDDKIGANLRSRAILVQAKTDQQFMSIDVLKVTNGGIIVDYKTASGAILMHDFVNCGGKAPVEHKVPRGRWQKMVGWLQCSAAS